MAHSRADVSLLEQSRRRSLSLALILAVLLLTGLAAVLGRRAVPRRQQVAGHAYAIPSPERRIVVEVLNGSRRQGAARTATRMLRRRGLDVVFFGNAQQASDSTRVIVRRGDPARGNIVRAALGSGRVVIQTDTLRRVDVSVLLGQDFQPQGELHP
jgi:hypothetical protein